MAPSISQRRHIRRIPAWAMTLLLVSLFNGCREREFISSPPATVPVSVTQDHWIRVLLAKDVKSCTIMIPSSYEILDTASGESLGKFIKNVGPSTAIAGGGQLSLGGKLFSNKQITIKPDQPFVFYISDKGYRGEVRLMLNTNGIVFDVINTVPLETYLAGVVGAEMPSYWEPEALKAQAIASRTYCLSIKERFGWQRSWDVNKTQANQMYLGLEAESPKVWDAVSQTTGQVLMCRDGSGKEGIFPTYFSSVCGGHTEDSKKVFGDSYMPLCGVECPWCRQVAARDMFFWPMIKFDKTYVTSQLTAKYPSLAKLGTIANIVVDKTSDCEGFLRITNVKLIGAGGQSASLRAEDLRLAVDPTGRKIRSTICKITAEGQTITFFSGRGFGHGVGLCQYGSQGMARKGVAARNILAHYYPGASITKLY
ncbi:MAG: SpoIID/LytB domain-containing protein [Sedimentisphaerales bacterium]|nr:SpoIID/LytB domain-containing protein [Sedimentisphaerales bacterium]